MLGGQWRKHLLSAPSDPVLRDWLTETGSLTTRCQKACRHFRVRLVRYGKGRALADEQPLRARFWVREVVLACDGVPVIFAHTTLSTATGGRLSRWLAGLGSRSLGSLLFTYPGFRRGAIEYCRLDRRHPLFRRAASWLDDDVASLWARRSVHCLGGQQVLVTEVFLPAIRELLSPPSPRR